MTITIGNKLGGKIFRGGGEKNFPGHVLDARLNGKPVSLWISAWHQWGYILRKKFQNSILGLQHRPLDEPSGLGKALLNSTRIQAHNVLVYGYLR